MNYYGVYHQDYLRRGGGICDAPCISKGRMMLCADGTASEGSLLAMVSSISGVVLPGMIPTIPAIAAQTSVNPFAIVTALAYGANITCVSPVSSMGAIALGIMGANREWDSNRLFKRMFAYAFILMGVAAVLAAIGIA